MKKTAGNKLKWHQLQPIRNIAGKIGEMFTGKKLQPMPSYWALVPVKQTMNQVEKINQMRNKKN